MAKSDFNTDWRKVSAVINKKPVDSKIFGFVEVDVTELERFINEKREAGKEWTQHLKDKSDIFCQPVANL